jgi:dihydrofolate reductase
MDVFASVTKNQGTIFGRHTYVEVGKNVRKVRKYLV